ncbi:MAG: YlxM family DNA-binding protein [Cellulosilyticaceae bacterium]
MEKFVEITYLFDFYQELLTDKQRELVMQYYFEDLSLGELAIQHNISRQSIFDTIKKAEQKLLDYEKKLCLYNKYRYNEEKLMGIRKVCETLAQEVNETQKKQLQNAIDRINVLASEI